jgi:hypothetical protein
LSCFQFLTKEQYTIKIIFKKAKTKRLIYNLINQYPLNNSMEKDAKGVEKQQLWLLDLKYILFCPS